MVAVATADGFAIALPYGRSTDWLKNVLASGSAVIVREGDAYEVDQPEIVGLETVDDRFAPADRRAHRTFGVAECVRMRRVERPFGSVEQRAAPAEQ